MNNELADYGTPRRVPDSRRKQVTSYFGHGRFATTCLYLYDFGDDWLHDLQLNDVVTLPEKFRSRLLGGEHPFPRDCGGVPGYTTIQAALATGEDPTGLLEWAREDDWTDVFDLEAAKRAFERGGRSGPHLV